MTESQLKHICPDRRGVGSSHASYGVTLLASLAFFTVGTNLLAFGTVQESAASDLSLSISASGLLVQAFFIPSALMQVPGGYLADRWGGEKTIALFSVITGLATVGLSFANSFSLALIFRLAVGFGGGPLLPAAVKSLTNHMKGHQYELANGFFSAGWGFSQIMVLNLLPVINAEFRWRAALLAVGIITFVIAGCAGFIAYLLRDTNFKQPEARSVKVRETLSRNMILLVLINVAGIVVPVTTLTWIPLRFQTLFQMSPVDVGRLLSVFGAVIVVSAIFGGVGARIIGRKPTIIISMSAATVAVAFLANPPNLTSGLLLTGVLGFGTMFYGSPTFAMVPEAAPAGKTNPGVVFGVFNTLSNGLAFFPPVLAALVLNSTHDFTYAFVTVTLVSAIGLLSALLLRPTKKDENS